MGAATIEGLIGTADSSFLIGADLINVFEHLPRIFHQIYVPDAVWTEVTCQGPDRPGARPLIAASYVERRSITDFSGASSYMGTLGQGEPEVLVLARELHCPFT